MDRWPNGKLVEFSTADGFVHFGYLVRPKAAKVCVIHVHGMTDNFYDSRVAAAMAWALSAKNIALFSINTRGHDCISRIRRTGKPKKFIGTNMERFEDCTKDIAGAVNAMRKSGFRKIILSGHSTGCQKITYYQSKASDRKVKSIILLAPADDYNTDRRTAGKRFGAVVARCKRLSRIGKGSLADASIPFGFSANRFLSVADKNKAEAKIFNYDGGLSVFSRVTVPVLVVFGSKEQHAEKPVNEYCAILKSKSASNSFLSKIIPGARHSFKGYEKQLAREVVGFVRDISTVSGKAGRSS
jgi:pimeloyl-ACP methyl ester carboxylesterase